MTPDLEALKALVELARNADQGPFESDTAYGIRKQLILDGFVERLPALERLLAGQQQPMNLLLYCPKCDRQHIDASGPDPEWTNPPHRSHKCRFPDCGHVWRPADVATNGVLALDTVGQLDGSPNPKDFSAPPVQEAGREPIAYEITGIDGDREYQRLDYCSEPLRAGEEVTMELYAASPAEPASLGAEAAAPVDTGEEEKR